MWWEKANICPNGSSILYCTTNGKLGTLKEGKIKDESDWKWYVDKYAIKCWIYQFDVINNIRIF